MGCPLTIAIGNGLNDLFPVITGKLNFPFGSGEMFEAVLGQTIQNRGKDGGVDPVAHHLQKSAPEILFDLDQSSPTRIARFDAGFHLFDVEHVIVHQFGGALLCHHPGQFCFDGNSELIELSNGGEFELEIGILHFKAPQR